MDNKEDCKLSRTSKLSKDLMYADYAGSTVVEHVLKSLEKKSNFSKSEEINRFLKTKKKTPEAFERAKNVLSWFNAHHEESVDDKEAIEEELTVGGEDSNCGSDGYKADVCFMPQPQSQELDSSDDEYQEKRSWISFSKANLSASDSSGDSSSDSSDESSSDSSEEETLQKSSESTGRKNLIEVIEDKSTDIDDKSKLNFSVSTGKRKFCNNIQNDSYVESDDESSDGESGRNFFVSTKRKKVFNTK